MVVLSLLKNNSRWAWYAENAFVSGAVLLLLISYAMYLAVIPSEKYGYSTVYHITHSFFMAVLAFWCLQKVFDRTWNGYLLWLPLLILALVNIFYIAPGRTGMLVFIALLMLTLLQRLTIINTVIAGTLACLLITGTYLTSANFSSRINQAIVEVQDYQTGSSRSSMGMRFDWWQNSLTMIREKPLWGHGMGAFETVQADLITSSTTKTQPSDNPHNEYLFIAVQTGLIGLGLFILLLGGMFFYSFRLLKPQRYLLQGVVVAMASGCLMNSFLFDSHQGHFFAILAAVLCSAPAATKPSSQ